jgi:hypothetical protein
MSNFPNDASRLPWRLSLIWGCAMAACITIGVCLSYMLGN